MDDRRGGAIIVRGGNHGYNVGRMARADNISRRDWADLWPLCGRATFEAVPGTAWLALAVQAWWPDPVPGTDPLDREVIMRTSGACAGVPGLTI